MSSLASEVNVANLALTDLGADRILALTEDSENARKVNAIFFLVRDSLLRSHPWNFAVQRRSFNQTTSTPEYGFDSEFQIPGDVLRILTAENRAGTTWVREGDKILVSDTSFKCRCIIRIEDPTKWDEVFVTTFAARLSAELAYSITDSRPVAADRWELFRVKFRQATGVDAQVGTPEELLVDEWIDSRLGGVISPRAF
jgi:hypothetical protein